MDEFKEMLAEYRRRIEKLEKKLENKRIVLPSDGVIIIPVMTADPASPTNGQMWINSTSDQFKIRKAGITKVVTLT